MSVAGNKITQKENNNYHENLLQNTRNRLNHLLYSIEETKDQEKTGDPEKVYEQLKENQGEILSFYKQNGYTIGRPTFIENGTIEYIEGGVLQRYDRKQFIEKTKQMFLKQEEILTHDGRKIKPQGITYYKKINEYQFYQRDCFPDAIQMINTNSPMQLFDTRIDPIGYVRIHNKQTKDVVYIFIYTPLNDPTNSIPGDIEKQTFVPANKTLRVKNNNNTRYLVLDDGNRITINENIYTSYNNFKEQNMIPKDKENGGFPKQNAQYKNLSFDFFMRHVYQNTQSAQTTISKNNYDKEKVSKTKPKQSASAEILTNYGGNEHDTKKKKKVKE